MNKFFYLILIFNLGAAPLLAQEIIWLSKPQDPNKYAGDSYYASFDLSGNLIAFQSKAQLNEEDGNQRWDVYLYDQSAAALNLINHTEEISANGGPRLSLNGQFLVYHSYPRHVLLGRKPRVSQIVLFDIQRRSGEIVTSLPEDQLQDGEGLRPVLSGDGERVVFTSNATNLAQGRTDGIRSVYIYDVKKKKLEIAPILNGELPDRASINPLISSDGRTLYFKSAATNLSPELENDSLAYHLYIYDIKKERLKRIDRREPDFNPEQFLFGQAVMTQDAEEIIFEASLKNEEDAMATLTNSNLYLYSKKIKNISLLTPEKYAGRTSHPRMTLDGRFLIFVYRAEKIEDGRIVVWDRKKDRNEELLDGTCERPEISPNGEWITFESQDPKWGASANKKMRQIYMIKNPLWKD